MPLCASDAAIISLDAMTGDLAIAADRRTARIPAGWSIRRLTAALWAQGLALANQGDDDPQSLAGAMATGTPGTGDATGSPATFARGFRQNGPEGAGRWRLEERRAGTEGVRKCQYWWAPDPKQTKN